MRAIFILLFVTTSLFGERRTVSFSDLRSGDTIVANYNSFGCWHSLTFNLTFRWGGSGECSVERPILKRSEDGLHITVEDWVPIGKLTLTEQEMRMLDASMEFYRSNTKKGCTTTDWIIVSQFHEGELIAREEFKDESCDIDGNPNLLSFWKLVRNLERSMGEPPNEDPDAANRRKVSDSGGSRSSSGKKL